MRPIWTHVIAGMVVLGAAQVQAQSPPPIHGVTGTVATEGTIKEEQKAAKKIIVTTEDGVEHVYGIAKGLLVHGGKDDLADLKPGTTVVIHYAPDNTAEEIDRLDGNGLATTEGIATKIDRGKKEITIRYDSGKVEKLRLTDRVAADVGETVQDETRVVVYYSEEAGQKVTHYFKKAKVERAEQR